MNSPHLMLYVNAQDYYCKRRVQDLTPVADLLSFDQKAVTNCLLATFAVSSIDELEVQS